MYIFCISIVTSSNTTELLLAHHVYDRQEICFAIFFFASFSNEMQKVEILLPHYISFFLCVDIQ